jgi:hypothetical protein
VVRVAKADGYRQFVGKLCISKIGEVNASEILQTDLQVFRAKGSELARKYCRRAHHTQ